jgi:hypothetical protein
LPMMGRTRAARGTNEHAARGTDDHERDDVHEPELER